MAKPLFPPRAIYARWEVPPNDTAFLMADTERFLLVETHYIGLYELKEVVRARLKAETIPVKYPGGK